MCYNSIVEPHEGDMTMPQRGGKREGSGRTPLPENEKKIAKTIYITPTLQSDIDKFANGNSFSEKCIDLNGEFYNGTQTIYNSKIVEWR